jgi:hypothetical protein
MMTTDVLRVEANERVDLSDFLFAVDESMRSQSRHWAANFIRDPLRDGPSWILTGFRPAFAAGLQLAVTRGIGILGYRENGEIIYGSLTTEGPVERIVDVTTFSNGTYGIYIRFELVEGQSSSRAFWNPQGDGSEFAQTISTRRLADWSVRLELTNPGGEWLKIGEATVSGSVVTGITDQRDFFFEGNKDDSYDSQWSTDGGGLSTDRNADRAQYGVRSLHTFTAATRQCLEDIKGRGLRRWWDRSIGGMNIGFDDDPVENRLAIGDATEEFRLFWDGTDPYLYWDDDNYFWFDRDIETLFGYAEGTLSFQLQGVGLRVRGLAVSSGISLAAASNTVRVGDASFELAYSSTLPTIYFDKGVSQAGWLRYDRTTNRLQMGTDDTQRLEIYDGFMVFEGNDYGRIGIRDTDFGLDFDTNNLPKVRWKSDAYFQFNRTSDQLDLFVGGTNLWRTGTVGTRVDALAVSDGLTLAQGGTDRIKIGDSDFWLHWDGFDPFIYFDYLDYIIYDRSADYLGLLINDSLSHRWRSDRYYIKGTAVTPSAWTSGDISYLQNTGVLAVRSINNTGSASAYEVRALSSLIHRGRVNDTAIGPSALDTIFNCQIRTGRSSVKMYRVLMWGTVREDVAGSNFLVNLFINVGGTPTVIASVSVPCAATLGTEVHNARDFWSVEAVINVHANAAVTNLHSKGDSMYTLSTFVDNHELLSSRTGNIDLLNNELEILGQVSNASTAVHTYDVCGWMVEELGGEDN